jgi:MFS family permease
MSPASYLAAPPRAVAGIVAPVFGAATIPGVSNSAWNWAIYGALIVGFLAAVGALALLLVRALEAWRAFKRLRRGIGRELERLADLGEATADKLGTATNTAKLERSLSELRVDLARFAVLRQALDEAQEAFSRIAWIYPSK